MKKQVLAFGLIASAVIIFYSIIVFLIFGDFDSMTPQKMTIMEVFGYLRYLILIIAIFFAMRSIRNQEPSGLSYMGLVKIGLTVTLIISLFIGIGELIYMASNPGFFDKYGEMRIQSLQAEGATPEAIDEQRKMMEDFRWMSNPFLSGIFYFFETFLIGAVVSFIFGVFLKPKKNISPSQT